MINQELKEGVKFKGINYHCLEFPGFGSVELKEQKLPRIGKKTRQFLPLSPLGVG